MTRYSSRVPAWRGVRAGAMTLRVALAALLFAAVPDHGSAQGLADFDYENLSFRGIAAEWGYIFPDRVESTSSLSARMDLGFLGPGVRVVTGVTHWSSFLVADEVGRLERRVEELVLERSGEVVEIDLGQIEWRDLALHADAHMMWQVPFGMLTFAGLGISAHLMQGSGRAIDDTFVEDLLDSVRAGINAHAGVEVPLHRRFRLLGQGRVEMLEDLRYLELRLGGQFMFRGWLPGEGD